MAFPRTFAAMTQPVMSYLDENFAAAGNLGVIPCAVSGTNSLTLTPIAGITPTVAAYADYLQFSGIVAVTNTNATQARIGALALLNVYKDSPSGPVALSGGELIAGNAFTLRYDSALNTGAGGWHLIANTAYSGGTISGSVFINNNLNVASLASVLMFRVGATAATIARVLTVSGTLTYTVVPANTNQMQTLACPGAQVNDVVQVGAPASVVAGTSFFGHVLAAGTLGITAVNSTAASLTPLTGIYRAAVTGFV